MEMKLKIKEESQTTFHAKKKRSKKRKVCLVTDDEKKHHSERMKQMNNYNINQMSDGNKHGNKHGNKDGNNVSFNSVVILIAYEKDTSSLCADTIPLEEIDLPNEETEEHLEDTLPLNTPGEEIYPLTSYEEFVSQASFTSENVNN